MRRLSPPSPRRRCCADLGLESTVDQILELRLEVVVHTVRTDVSRPSCRPIGVVYEQELVLMLVVLQEPEVPT